MMYVYNRLNSKCHCIQIADIGRQTYYNDYK
jgi:hypothetical protein